MTTFLNTKTGRGLLLAAGLLAIVSLGYWPVIALIAIVTFVCILEIVSFFKSVEEESIRIYAAVSTQMFIVMIGAQNAARVLNEHGVWLIMVIASAVYAENAAAQIFGKRFGRTKLFPRYSPKKTVAGAIWGWIIGSIVGVGFLGLAWQFGGVRDQIAADWKKWLAIIIIAPSLAEIGDWLESRLKRIVGVKDSGEIIASHPRKLTRIVGLSAVFGRQGGALDKTDSLWFVITAAYLILATSWQAGLVLALGVVAAIMYVRMTQVVHHQ